MLVPVSIPGWREALEEQLSCPKNTIKCFQPGLEPGQLSQLEQELIEHTNLEASTYSANLHTNCILLNRHDFDVVVCLLLKVT